MSLATVTKQKSDHVVSHYDVYRELRTALHMFQKFPLDLDDKERGLLAQEVVKQSAIETAVLRSQESDEVEVVPVAITAALDEIVAQFPDTETLESSLDHYGMDMAMLQDAVERDLHVSAILEYVAEDAAEVTDVDVELFFELHSDRFGLPERRTVRHMLVTINEEFEDNTREKSQARIEEALHKLKHTSLQFEKLAKMYSECPTALEGGVLGTLAKGQLYPELDEVLFNMKVGEVSRVIESPLGFHILRCDEVEPPQIVDFNEVKEKIKLKLQERNQRAHQKKWLQQRMAEIAH